MPELTPEEVLEKYALMEFNIRNSTRPQVSAAELALLETRAALAASQRRTEALEAIDKYGLVVGPEFQAGWGPAKRIGWAVYVDWLAAARDTFSENSSQCTLAVHADFAEAVRMAVAALASQPGARRSDDA